MGSSPGRTSVLPPHLWGELTRRLLSCCSRNRWRVWISGSIHTHSCYSAWDVNGAIPRRGTCLFSLQLKHLYPVPCGWKHCLWNHTGLCLNHSSAAFELGGLRKVNELLWASVSSFFPFLSFFSLLQQLYFQTCGYKISWKAWKCSCHKRGSSLVLLWRLNEQMCLTKYLVWRLSPQRMLHTRY